MISNSAIVLRHLLLLFRYIDVSFFLLLPQLPGTSSCLNPFSVLKEVEVLLEFLSYTIPFPLSSLSGLPIYFIPLMFSSLFTHYTVACRLEVYEEMVRFDFKLCVLIVPAFVSLQLLKSGTKNMQCI